MDAQARRSALAHLCLCTGAQRRRWDERQRCQEQHRARWLAQGAHGGAARPRGVWRGRAAPIAARMARLGGARVGMGPPVFGKKPVPPPKKPSMDDTKPAEKTEEKAVDEVPPVRVSMDDTPSSSSEPHPGASTDNLSLASNSSSPPTSMPIPAAPKRAGPPRRKTATKSPSPALPSEEPVSTPPAPAPEPVLSEDAIHKSPEPVDTTESSVSEAQLAKEEGAMSGDTEKEIGGVIQSADEVKEDAPEPIKERPLSSSSDLRPESPVTSPDIKPAEPIIESAVPSVTRLPDPEPATHIDEPEEAAVEREEPAPVIQEEEEDEETRRKRIAERVAKMGGFNPFTAPPPPEATSTEPEEIESPTIPQRKSSVASVGSTSFPSRKESMGSVYPSSVPERKDSAFFAPPQHEEVVEAERPPMPVRKESLNVVPQRQASIDIASPTQLSVPSPPVLARKDSSSSMQSYTVTQIGGGRKVTDDKEDGDEGPRLPDRSQVEIPAQGTEHVVSEMESGLVSSSVRADNDEEHASDHDEGDVRREGTARVGHEGAEIDTGISQEGDGAEEERPLDGDDDEGAVVDAHFVSDLLPPSPAPIPVPTNDANNGHLQLVNDNNDDEEMAPPRPTRSLPPPPPAPASDMSTRYPTSPPPPSPPKRVSMSPATRAIPVPAPMNETEEMYPPQPPSKRTSIPPPSRGVPTPYTTEYSHAKTESQEQDDATNSPDSRRTPMQPPARALPSSPPTSPPRSSTKRTSMPPPSRAVPVYTPAEDKIVQERPLAQEPDEFDMEEEAPPSPPPRKPSLPTSIHSPVMSASSGSRRSSQEVRRSIDSPRMFTLPPPPPVPVAIAPAEPEHEILDDEDGGELGHFVLNFAAD
ncbi:hypothetical protein OF83DRAFT_470144 [Amylostereum chailletii]|nr:hypothetical protein OF83DRAFT_470144 [Amylostereum chailletii]